MDVNKLMSLSQAAESLPTRPAASSLWRWGRQGLRVGDRRVFLKLTKLGRRTLVHPNDLARFVQESTAADAAQWREKTAAQGQDD